MGMFDFSRRVRRELVLIISALRVIVISRMDRLPYHLPRGSLQRGLFWSHSPCLSCLLSLPQYRVLRLLFLYFRNWPWRTRQVSALVPRLQQNAEDSIVDRETVSICLSVLDPRAWPQHSAQVLELEVGRQAGACRRETELQQLAWEENTDSLMRALPRVSDAS